MLQCETMKERERVRLANVFLQMFPYVALLVFQEFWIPMLHMHWCACHDTKVDCFHSTRWSQGPAHCKLMSVSEPGFSVTVFKMDEHAPPSPPPMVIHHITFKVVKIMMGFKLDLNTAHTHTHYLATTFNLATLSDGIGHCLLEKLHTLGAVKGSVVHTLCAHTFTHRVIRRRTAVLWHPRAVTHTQWYADIQL